MTKSEQGHWAPAEGAEGIAQIFVPDQGGIDHSQLVTWKPVFKDDFKATGKAVHEILPREISGGRAPNRPQEIRASGQLIEVDVLRKQTIHTVVIDREKRTIAYCGEREASDKLDGMVSENREGLKPHPLKSFDDVVGEISASLEKAYLPSK